MKQRRRSWGGRLRPCIPGPAMPSIASIRWRRRRDAGWAEACRTCVVRNAVSESVRNRKVVRRGQKMFLTEDGNQREVYLLVTTAPIKTAAGPYVMLLLEDVGELVEARRLLPICMHCGKVRDEDSYWSSVDEYFKKHLDLDFSHGICNDCMKKLYPDLVDEEPRGAPGPDAARRNG